MEILAQSGIHGHIADARLCMDCHSDHKGVDFNPSQAALPFFDHTVTRFDLLHHQVGYDRAPMACSACHTQSGQEYAFQPESCTDCHAQKDKVFVMNHLADFGTVCLDCHDGKDRMADFDHEKTAYPLLGQHTQATCTGCHDRAPTGEQFKGLTQVCKDCHAEPETHRGVFATTCEGCHDPSGWTPAKLDGASFDHLIQTGFSLVMHQKDYGGGLLNCNTCHVKDLNTFDPQTCIDCHYKADASLTEKHVASFGPVCKNCHDGVDRMQNFDHNQTFVLDGRHSEIQCADCHGADLQTAKYKGTPKECVACHQEPQIHAGAFGVVCQDCHSTTAWQPAYLRNHTFPLDHGGTPVACEVCHLTTYQEYTCYGCHDHQKDEMEAKHNEENIPSADLPNCTKCHATGQKGD